MKNENETITEKNRKLRREYHISGEDFERKYCPTCGRKTMMIVLDWAKISICENCDNEVE